MIKAIDTSYKGYLFRSRLEARWAVFFDALGLEWEYEPEGFVLPDGTRYLPDFCVQTPQGNPIWYEIKPKHIRRDGKHEAFDRMSNEQALSERGFPAVRTSLLSGDPVDVLFELGFLVCPRCGALEKPDSFSTQHDAVDFMCYPCDAETPVGVGADEIGFLGLVVTPYKGWQQSQADEYRDMQNRLLQAAQAARAARFEHGATRSVFA